jgi:hypothetical protein
MTQTEDDKRPLDQNQEKAGYFLILVGGLGFLFAVGGVFAVALGAELDANVKYLVYVAGISAALAGFGALTLLSPRHYAGFRAKAGQAEVSIEDRKEE